MQIHNAPQRSQRLRGDDRLVFVENVQSYESRSVILSMPFVPQLVPRMATEAAAWQRIRYRSLKFTLVPQVGTAAAGGLVMSFVKDSTDPVPAGEEGLRRLFAQDSAVSTPIWESASITVTGLTDKYYTNWDATSPRWSSPGQICVMTEGKPSVSGSLTLYVEYDVTFYSADVAPNAVSGVGEVVVTTLPKKGSTPHLYLSAGSRNVAYDSKEKPDWQQIFPGSRPGDVLRLPSPRYFLINKDNTPNGLDQFWFLKLTTDGYCCPCEMDGTLFTSLTYNNVDVLINSEEVVISMRDDKKSLTERGWRLLCHPCPLLSFQQSSGPLNMRPEAGWEML